MKSALLLAILLAACSVQPSTTDPYTDLARANGAIQATEIRIAQLAQVATENAGATQISLSVESTQVALAATATTNHINAQATAGAIELEQAITATAAEDEAISRHATQTADVWPGAIRLQAVEEKAKQDREMASLVHEQEVARLKTSREAWDLFAFGLACTPIWMICMLSLIVLRWQASKMVRAWSDAQFAMPRIDVSPSRPQLSGGFTPQMLPPGQDWNARARKMIRDSIDVWNQQGANGAVSSQIASDNLLNRYRHYIASNTWKAIKNRLTAFGLVQSDSTRGTFLCDSRFPTLERLYDAIGTQVDLNAKPPFAI